jgi:hypothetical protein
MKKFTLISDKEYNAFKDKYQLTSDNDIKIKKRSEVEKLYEYYNEILKLKDVDADCKTINKIIADAEKEPIFDYKKNIIVEDGYEIMIIDKGVHFYKALTWFYDKMPESDRTWCASIQDMMLYLKIYYIGSLAYKTTKKIRLFMLSNANLKRLLNDNCPKDISEKIQDIFNIVDDLETAIKQQYRNKPLYVFRSYDCYKDAEQTFFKISSHKSRYQTQQLLYDYIEKRFKCDGTSHGPIVSPFKKCAGNEYAINPKVLEIDAKSTYTWMNWGLTSVKEIGHFNIDVINSIYSNANNKLYYWLKTYNNLDYSYSDVLSINVHYLAPIFKMTKDDAVDELIKYVNKINPKILALQEMPFEYVSKVRKQCNFYQSYYVSNGMYNNKMVLAVFVKKYTPALSIKASYDLRRGSIMLLINNKRLMFVHGPIGKSYFYRSSIVYIDQFYSLYDINVKMQETFLNDILSHKPDFIIGDFNIMPIATPLQILRKAGYNTSTNESPTSYHGVKVDWAWYKPELVGKFHIYNWHMSDHRPVGFTFDKWNGISGWDKNNKQTNNMDWNGDYQMTYGNIKNTGTNMKKWVWHKHKGGDEYMGGDEYTDDDKNVFLILVLVLIILLIYYLFDSVYEIVYNIYDYVTTV